MTDAAREFSAVSFPRLPPSRKRTAQEPGEPYPGIRVRCGSELLDFGFENTEILQGGDD
jgi:hypothetical protein